ncbi:SRPBCC family protein [Massilia sp. S19_KUP03_FR1]|uniref:SRPBCC family protein n=1 Tax=Massilia sp. S19_KUP03_FR1 TaxID=3025503 RepID=UPI002FCDBCD9
MLTRLAPFLLLALALPAWGAAAALAVSVERADDTDGGKVYRITSSGTVAASPATVWRILTDYERMPEYVPDLRSARVLSRDGAKVIIEQQGGVQFLVFSRAIHLVVQVQERAPDQIDVSLVDGDMKVYRASWALRPAGAGGTRVDYSATIAPKFYVPGLVGTSIVRKDIANMMAAVLARLDRGAAAAPAP